MVLKKNTRKIKTRNKNKRKSNIIKTRINLHKKHSITNKKKRYITRYTKKHYNSHGGGFFDWFKTSPESTQPTVVNSPQPIQQSTPSTFSKFTNFFNSKTTASSANTTQGPIPSTPTSPVTVLSTPASPVTVSSTTASTGNDFSVTHLGMFGKYKINRPDLANRKYTRDATIVINSENYVDHLVDALKNLSELSCVSNLDIVGPAIKKANDLIYTNITQKSIKVINELQIKFKELNLYNIENIIKQFDNYEVLNDNNYLYFYLFLRVIKTKLLQNQTQVGGMNSFAAISMAHNFHNSNNNNSDDDNSDDDNSDGYNSNNTYTLNNGSYTHDATNNVIQNEFEEFKDFKKYEYKSKNSYSIYDPSTTILPALIELYENSHKEKMTITPSYLKFINNTIKNDLNNITELFKVKYPRESCLLCPYIREIVNKHKETYIGTFALISLINPGDWCKYLSEKGSNMENNSKLTEEVIVPEKEEDDDVYKEALDLNNDNAVTSLAEEALGSNKVINNNDVNSNDNDVPSSAEEALGTEPNENDAK